MHKWNFLVGAFYLAAVVYTENLEPCGGKPADVFFLLDSSGSLLMQDFERELKFTKDVISMFDTKENNVRVGVATFSEKLTPQVELGEYTDRSDLLDKISFIEHEGKGTNTGDALSYLHVKGLSRSNVREGLPHVAIVLTDGMSQNPDSTLKEAAAVHQSGITVFVIGVGNQVDEKELRAIASKPAEKYVYLIDDFGALEKIKEKLAVEACEDAFSWDQPKLANEACQAQPITPAPDIQSTQAAVEEELINHGSCTPRHSLDMVFAIDTAAVGASNTKFVLRFIGNVSEHINMKTGDVSISSFSSGCSGGTFEESVSFDPETVKSGLSKFESPEFPKMMREMRLKARDGRQGTKHVGIIFMVDPLSSRDFRYAQMERRRAMYQKTEIFVFGVGNRMDESQGRRLATEHGGYIHVYGFDSLDEAGMQFLYRVCILGL